MAGGLEQFERVGEVAPHVALAEHEELQPLVTAGLLLVDGHVALVAARSVVDGEAVLHRGTRR